MSKNKYFLVWLAELEQFSNKILQTILLSDRYSISQLSMDADTKINQIILSLLQNLLQLSYAASAKSVNLEASNSHYSQ